MKRKRLRSTVLPLGSRGAEQSGRDLADRAVPARSGGDGPCTRPDGGVRVGNRYRPADEFKAREVVDVVADIGGAARVDAELGAPPGQLGALVGDAVPCGHLELQGAGGDYPV